MNSKDSWHPYVSNPSRCLPRCSGQNPSEFFDSSLSLTPTPTLANPVPSLSQQGLQGTLTLSLPRQQALSPERSRASDRPPPFSSAHPRPTLSPPWLFTMEWPPSPFPHPLLRTHKASPYLRWLPQSTRVGTNRSVGHWWAIPAQCQAQSSAQRTLVRQPCVTDLEKEGRINEGRHTARHPSLTLPDAVPWGGGRG